MHLQLGDATLSVLSHMDIPTIAVFSNTSKQDRESTAAFFNLQFGYLLDYCKISEKKDFPLRFKINICFGVGFIKNSLQLGPEPEYKLPFLKINRVINSLKLFYEIIPKDEIPAILQLKCKFLIAQMLEFKKKDDYIKIRKQIVKMKGFYPEIKREDTVNLFSSGYCLRYSSSEKDSYGNPKIVLSAKHKTANKVYHFLIEVEELKNFLQFQTKITEKLEIVSSLNSKRKIELFESFINYNARTCGEV